MDIAHEQTDAIIAKVEKKVKKEYVQAQKEIERKKKNTQNHYSD